MSVSYGGDSITFADGSVTSSGWTGFKNRIINGAMTIDQRYAGAANTIPIGVNQYISDRWYVYSGQAGKLIAQQMNSANSSASNYESGSAPAGFINSLKVTSNSAYTLTSGDTFYISQVVEGNNISDLNWGTPNASSATLSFWVKSSLTGTFSGSLATNNGTVYSYPFNYTISSANTWTYVTIPIAAATSATPYTNNSYGVFLRLGLGTLGTNAGGTVQTWTSSGNYVQTTGSVSLVSTNAATFYLTGVQLEKGSTASSFEYRPYGVELQLCYRYFYKSDGGVLEGAQSVTSYTNWFFPSVMRATPTFTAGTSADYTSATIYTDRVYYYKSGSYAYLGSGATVSAEL